MISVVLSMVLALGLTACASTETPAASEDPLAATAIIRAGEADQPAADAQYKGKTRS
jgi:hypothetical protein